MEQHKFKPIKPQLQQPCIKLNNQQSSISENLKLLLSPSSRAARYSNGISSRKAHKPKCISQAAFYESPLLNNNQLEQIDRYKQQDKNDFFGQLTIKDPYEYPKSLRDLKDSGYSAKQSTVKVQFKNDESDKLKQIGIFSKNLSLRKSRDRLHRGIPQKHDVKVLAEWVDIMIQQAMQKVDSQQNTQIFDEIQEIFTHCLKELIRQISIDCIEKSILLEKIWTQYVEINQSVIVQIIDEKKQIEKQGLTQLMKTHQLYQLEIDNFLLIIKNLREELSTMTDRFIKVKENGKYLKKTNRNAMRELKLTKFELNDMRQQNKYQQNEIDELKEYIEDAQRDLKNQYQSKINKLTTQLIVNQQSDQTSDISQVKQQSSPSTKRRLTRSETTTFQLPLLQLDVQNTFKEDFRVIHVKNKNRTMHIEKSAIQQQEEALQQEDQSINMSDIENIVAEKQTSTEDIVEILGLTTSIEVQTLVSKINQTKKEKQKSFYLRPDCRQQITQTQMSYFMTQEKETQTEILKEIGLELEEEEEELTKEIMNLQETFKELQYKTELKIPSLHQYIETLQNVTNKLEVNVQKQREYRTSVQLTNDQIIYVSNKKTKNIEELKSKNEELQNNIEMISQDLIELEQQVEAYDQINRKMEYKYNKAKNKKQVLLEKTQNLVSNISKTYQFRDIMKKKIMAKRKSQVQDPSAKLSPERSPNRKSDQNIPQFSPSERENNKQWNIHITIPEEQSQQPGKRDSNESFVSPQDSLDQSIISQQSVQSMRSVDKQFATSRSQKNNSNFQLIPNTSKGEKAKTSRKPSATVKKSNSPVKNNNNNEQIQFIQDTIQNFLDENISDVDSSDSSFSVTSRLQELQKRKSQIHQRKGVFAAGPKFQNKNVDNTQQINQQRSLLLCQTISDKIAQHPKSITAKMQKMNVLKMIAQFYSEKIRLFQNKNTPLHQICYEYYFNTYGFKNIAEQKITNFYYSVFAYSSNSTRIHLFGRFLELYSPLNLDDLEIYIQTMKYLDENEVSLNLATVVHDKGVHIPVERAIFVLEQHHSCIPFDQRNSIIKELRNNQFDKNYKPHIDLDFYSDKILAGYRVIRDINQEHFDEVFYAADMDLDGMIEFQEFQKLFYHFELKQGNPMQLGQVQRNFLQQCDLIGEETGEKAMSFNRFVTFSIENKLFTRDKFKTFANNVATDDPIKTLENLEINWNQVRKSLLFRIQDSTEEMEYYQSIVKKLDAVFINFMQALSKPEKKQSLWISYRIIDTDTKDIYIRKLMEDFIPIELQMLNKHFQEIFEGQD